jgi:hypothetical protein
VLFLLLAYDEAAQMHERLIPLGRALFGGQGVLYFAWVVFGAIFVGWSGSPTSASSGRCRAATASPSPPRARSSSAGRWASS